MMTMARTLIFAALLLFSAGAYAATLHDVDMAWSKQNLYTINLLEKLREIEETDKKNQRRKEQILQFRDSINVINERIYDCYIICELSILNYEKDKAFSNLSGEFLKIKKHDITEKIELLKVLSSLAKKDKDPVLMQMIDEYVNLSIETADTYNQCYE